MKHTWSAKILSTAIAACLAFSSMPAFADGTKQIKVTLTDVTATDAATLSGEAKVKVSVEGADGNVSIAQTALDFNGDLKYKSVNYLQGSDNPGGGDSQITSINGNKITTGIISSKSGMNFGSNEDLFVITFSGEPGKETTLSLSDLENTYFTIDGQEYFPDSAAQITVKTSEKENKGKTATVRLTMDKVTGFSGAAKTGITVKITSEKTDNYSIDTMLDNTLISKGGHRDGTSTIPKFAVENAVLADDTYTVEVAGIGYITYTKTGVTFDTTLEITNAEFIPGDVNGDGKVDAGDKALAKEYVKNGEKNEAADFNRDGKVDAEDLTVFDGIADKTVPAKMTAPTVTGGNKKITVKWAKPADESITGYTIKYGTSKDKLTSTKEIDKADTVNAEITIGQATVTGYGKYTLKVDDSASTNVVNATTLAASLVESYATDGSADGNLDITSSTTDKNGQQQEIKIPTRKLSVKINMNNKVADQVKAYQAMKVDIAGGDYSETIALGSDAVAQAAKVYTVEKDLPINTAYTVTVSGAGYRTARYTVNLTSDKTLNFWNNVADNAIEVELGNDTYKKDVTFLAGDIVKDGTINIYDLSAVVSYFGTINNVDAESEYAKYDLNRDGKIDSKDVAYVLVSWGK